MAAEIAKQAKGGSGKKESVPGVIKDFDAEVFSHLPTWLEQAKAVGNDHLVKQTEAGIAIIELTRAIVWAIAESKPVTAQDMLKHIQESLGQKVNASQKLINKNLDFKNHSKAVNDGISLFQWYLQGDAVEHAKEAVVQIDYFGNKVLMAQKPDHTAWYNTWRRTICQNLFGFIKEHFADGHPNDRQGGDFGENFKKRAGSSGSSQPAEEKKEEKKVTKAPAKKEAEKGSSKPKRKPQTNRIPGKSVEVAFYENETLQFSDQDVNINIAYNFLRSKSTNLVIKGKIKSIMAEGCENCAIVVDTVVTAIELINCKNVKVQVTDKTSQYILDKCDNTNLYLSEEGKKSKIITTNSKTTILNFPAVEEDENGNDERSIAVFESWQTTIKDDVLVSEPVDLD